jgi:hypothetical protein
MTYQRYFKSGQKLLLRVLDHADEHRTEFLSAVIDSVENDLFIITLLYGENAADQYPFTQASTFQLSSEALGLGIQVTGHFEKKISGTQISLKIEQDLQVFQRRQKSRIDCKIGIRFTRGKGTLKALRNTWEKNIQVLHSPDAPLIFEGFKPCQVNISSSGICFNLRPPASQGELCLILINLEDGKAPICTLAEIIWTRLENDDSIIVAGMRFINILEEDQKRIDVFANSRGRQ